MLHPRSTKWRQHPFTAITIAKVVDTEHPVQQHRVMCITLCNNYYYIQGGDKEHRYILDDVATTATVNP